jgi:hypothetical protein
METEALKRKLDLALYALNAIASDAQAKRADVEGFIRSTLHEINAIDSNAPPSPVPQPK